MLNLFENLSPIIQSLLAGLFTWFITILGASLVIFFKKVNQTILNISLALSAGIMTSASIFSLIEPSLEIARNININPFISLIVGIILGIILILLFEYIYTFLINKRGKTISDKKKRSILLISSITLHNIPEGLIIGVSFGSLIYHIEGVSLLSSIALAIGIGIQNFPEGAAISLPLRREGYKRKNAFLIGAMSAIVEPISAIIGAILVMKVRLLLPYLLPLAAGAMLYVSFGQLIPESQNDKNKNIMTIATIIGFLIMMILDITL